MNPMTDNAPKVKVAARSRAAVSPMSVTSGSVLLLVAIVVLLINGAVSGI